LPDSRIVIEQINVEFELIDRLFKTYGTLLQRAVEDDSIDVIEATALASVVHSFYNGLENVFTIIGKRFDHTMPTGEQWHRSLLFQMGKPTPFRRSVLSDNTIVALGVYLAFRHFYRHSYSYFVDWNKLRELVISMDLLWSQVKSEIQTFIYTLETEE
jgi:hypothetical protein